MLYIFQIWTGGSITVWLKLRLTTTTMLPSSAAVGLMLREQQRPFLDYLEVRTTGMHETTCSRTPTTRSYQLAYWLLLLTSSLRGRWKSDTPPVLYLQVTVE
ncbi:hypothetical protein PHET_01745 [Paragonimus heterotremus]|uniref:Uncharacterized protein n=1 Tax=Paragonimus heterotremus TaxID=100268 RepID=A0A8J4WJ63_9TREM|nr:hypothetical protein PHET_01745 [Paragonimus heterotremus]